MTKKTALQVKRRRVLVTGCCRSGTLYASLVWRALGYDVQHENVGKFGCSSSLFVVDDREPDFYNILPPEWNKRPRHEGGPRSMYQFDVVLHQVRHPLKVIASQAKSYNRSAKAWFDRVGIAPVDTKPNLIHAVRVWLKMTEMADELSTYRYRLEDIEQEWPHILALCGLKYVPLPDVNTKANAGHGFTKPVEGLTLAVIAKHSPTLARMVAKRGASYGYDLGDVP